MIDIELKRLPHGDGLPLPAYATEHAAGMDVVAAEALTLAPGERALVATGFAIAIPPGYEVQVRPRSGLALKYGITCLNTPGTIDADYRGEVKVLLINHGAEPFAIQRGERIAQLVPAAVTAARFVEVEALGDTRGDRGVRVDRTLMAAGNLSDEELGRYARHVILKEIGGSGQARLKTASVLVVGAGGIGSPAIQYLAAAGVGRLVLVDDDVVDASNLARQTIYESVDAGRPKVEAAAERAARLNPHITVEPHRARVDAASVPALLAGVDVVLDGSDNFATRLAVADAALAARVPLVAASVIQLEGQLGVFRGWEAGKPCYRCFVGSDPGREAASCADEGVLGPVAGVMGSLAALEVIRALVPFGDEMAGRVLLVDALAMRFRTLTLPKDPGCACAA